MDVLDQAAERCGLRLEKALVDQGFNRHGQSGDRRLGGRSADHTQHGLVAFTQTVATRWIERHRATRVIALASLVNAVAFGVFAALSLVPSWAVPAGLLGTVVVHTLAEVLGSPSMGEISVYMAPAHARGRYLGVYQLSWSLGGAVAPVVPTSLLDLVPSGPGSASPSSACRRSPPC